MAGFLFVWYYRCSGLFTMAATITWDIATLERQLSDGMVTTVHYTVSAEDQGKTSGAYGSLGLDPADPNNFIAYNDLTKAEVIGWVKDKLGTEQVANIETGLENQIQQELNPTSSTGVPW